MDEISAISGALTSLKTAKDIAQAMMGLRDNTAFQSKMIEFQSAILDAQNAAFAANEERTTLIERIGALEEKMGRMEAWNTEKQRYELKEIPPGVFVYELKADSQGLEPPHNICANCYQNNKKSILNSGAPNNGLVKLHCPSCNTSSETGYWNPPRLY